jgi:DMSO/TMAO reductase YedYZ heme-binding membrane subunit
MATTRDYGRDLYPPDYPQDQYQAGYPQDQYQAGNAQDQYQAGNAQDQYQAGYPQDQYQASYPQDQYQASYPQDQYQASYQQDQYQADYQQDQHQAGAVRTRDQDEEELDDLYYRPKRGPKAPGASKNRVDQWMEGKLTFGGSGIKRKTAALLVLGAVGLFPIFCMLPALFTLNTTTFATSVDDTLGTGAEINLFMCLLVTPFMILTGERWFFPLRRWFGILMAVCAFGDGISAGLVDPFFGNFLEKLTEHTFTLIGFTMMILLLPLLMTGNNWAQRRMGKYWKILHRLIYVVWGLLFFHLATLEGFGFERRADGSGFAGDGDPIFHQRLYQYSACSVFLLTLRLPPVKRWIAARQKEGREWLVAVAVVPIFMLFLFGFIFIWNEMIFKGMDSFTEHPSAE